MAFIRDNGWWLPRASDAKPTHLLLDGGKARVPDESAGAFLSAYAIAVVQNTNPCVVELRTPVFKLFLDMDIKVSKDASLVFDDVVRILQRRVAEFFVASDSARAVVCTTSEMHLDDCVKAGRHVVWTDVFVTSSTALAFRAAVVADLEARMPGACCKPWATVVDACVFKANGLRMPFSCKGRDNLATYVPATVWVGDEGVAVDAPSGVAAVRDWVRQLSIRTFGVDETPVRDGVVLALDDHHDEDHHGVSGVSKSLAEYADVLPELDAALPVQFAGQRFTGVIKTDTCFMLRSSAQYCMNIGKRHNSNNVYFVLTRKGIRQKCYCRCETTDGRKYGMCKDFGSDLWTVPEKVIEAFFGKDPPPPPPQNPATAFKPSLMPSATAMSVDNISHVTLRPPLTRKRRR